MHPDIVVALIQAVPRVLWVVFAAALILYFEKALRNRILPRMTGFSLFGVEASFVQEELDKALSRRGAPASEEDRARVLRRLRRVAPVFRGASLLWVDGEPEQAAAERAMLRLAGASVDAAGSTEEALSRASERSYDAIVSDIRFGHDAGAGLRLLDALRRGSRGAPVIFYVGGEDARRPVPEGAFDLTDRADVLLHAVADVLERRRS